MDVVVWCEAYDVCVGCVMCVWDVCLCDVNVCVRYELIDWICRNASVYALDLLRDFEKVVLLPILIFC